MTLPLTDPVLLLGLMAFASLLLALPIAFWSLSGNPGALTQKLVRILVVAANLLLTTQLVWRWLDRVISQSVTFMNHFVFWPGGAPLPSFSWSAAGLHR